MDKTSKTILMANGEKMVIPKPTKYFTLSEKHHIIQEYLTTSISKSELWKKYTGKPDHGRLLVWMRKLGYQEVINQVNTTFVDDIDKQVNMLAAEKLPNNQPINGEGAPSGQDHQRKIIALELALKLAQKELGLAKKDLQSAKKELELAQVKAIAYSTMIDLAEKEFNIPIRKK
jgi:hypothetical protein